MATKDADKPNRQLMTVQTTENHIRGAINSLCDLTELSTEQANLQGDCVTALLHFQSKELIKLRRMVECP
ncbi:MAG TPA: hypothetical protein VMW24_22010 [Sedimentisphaerales bacterium]|nr:hypothetical protein [Sedimentisphaerales bacterium]